MPSAISELYEPLIGRDLAAIPEAVRHFRQSHDSDALWSAVARFAVLAYAPSQHARHAVLAALAAYELRDEAGERWDDLLVECARYASASRQPWSEPPISDPPSLPANQRGDLGEIREAIVSRERLRAERWLAGRMNDADFARDFFTVATDDLGDLGHNLIVAVAAWQIAARFDPRGRFATLRIATWEWTSRAGGGDRRAQAAGVQQDVWRTEADAYVANGGDVESAHRLFLLDAAERAIALGAEPGVLDRVGQRLGTPETIGKGVVQGQGETERLIYPLARDYAACLQIHALTRRRGELPTAALRGAAIANLESSDFTEWSFA